MTTEQNNTFEDDDLPTKINRETARIDWHSLAPHFAAGNVITIEQELDLVLAAKAMAEDNSQQIQEWMQKNLVANTSDAQAIEWQENNTELWAVVIKPWILVQVPK